MKSILKTSGNRFKLGSVALAVFGGAFSLVVFNYAIKYISNEPFNWERFWEYFPNLLLGAVMTTVFSYFTLNYFHSLFIRRKGFVHFIIPLSVCLLIIQAYNILVDHYLPLEANRNNPMPLDRQIVGNLLVGVLYSLFILVLAVIYYLRDVRQSHKKLEEQKLKLEVEKMQADLKFLKSQINPHFLHNTLNSFYARSLPLSKELADGILTLSEMMRYALGEAFTADGKVLLRDEIEHLKNFIKMNQFRFRNNLHVELEVKGKANGAVILPFVLITLVENIFKHGDLSDSEFPIKIYIEINDCGLRYYSKNKKRPGPKELSTGIGLDNIQKRLQLAYGDDYALNVKNENDCYATELIIQKL
ncbi:histidine kinase [Flavisolibacter sp. BT320]|nr:histidine kinase [Flavisolibacter longurius]